MERDEVRKKIRQDHPAVFELADRIPEFTSAALPSEIPFTGKNTESAWRFWNAGFLVAGHRLFRAVLLLVEEGLSPLAEVQKVHEQMVEDLCGTVRAAPREDAPARRAHRR